MNKTSKYFIYLVLFAAFLCLPPATNAEVKDFENTGQEFNSTLEKQLSVRDLAKTERDMLLQMHRVRDLPSAVKYFAPFVLTFRGGLN
jgi:hypothetical protein